MTMQNKYANRSRISEKKFREIVKYFSMDLEQQKLPNYQALVGKLSINI